MQRQKATIAEIAGGIYRISTWVPEAGITFNQFLIDDERPTLIHTGMYDLYDGVRRAIAEVLDPARLRFVALLHFEADECGGMDRFTEAAPQAVLVASELSATVNLAGWNHRGRVRAVRDGELLELGAHRLRFLETPHVHHWDSMMIFEESTRSVFPADLYTQAGEQPAIVDQDLGTEMCAYYRQIGIFAAERPVRAVIERLTALSPAWMHAMHGGSLRERVIPRYTQALREHEFAYAGRLLGREIQALPRS